MQTYKIVIFSIFLSIPIFAQEKLTLTTPISVSKTGWDITSMFIDVQGSRIIVSLLSNNGEVLVKTYDASTTPTGAFLISNLNTANLTTRSLLQRVFDRLITDGAFVGTVTGTPR